jgi:hypothetical protein
MFIVINLMSFGLVTLEFVLDNIFDLVVSSIFGIYLWNMFELSLNVILISSSLLKVSSGKRSQERPFPLAMLLIGFLTWHLSKKYIPFLVA